jgi:hypothetical protein
MTYRRRTATISFHVGEGVFTVLGGFVILEGLLVLDAAEGIMLFNVVGDLLDRPMLVNLALHGRSSAYIDFRVRFPLGPVVAVPIW